MSFYLQIYLFINNWRKK